MKLQDKHLSTLLIALAVLVAAALVILDLPLDLITLLPPPKGLHCCWRSRRARSGTVSNPSSVWPRRRIFRCLPSTWRR